MKNDAVKQIIAGNTETQARSLPRSRLCNLHASTVTVTEGGGDSQLGVIGKCRE